MALPVAVAGSVVAEDIVVAAPTGACAPTVAAHDLLVAEAITGAEVFGADRQQGRGSYGGFGSSRSMTGQSRGFRSGRNSGSLGNRSFGNRSSAIINRRPAIAHRISIPRSMMAVGIPLATPAVLRASAADATRETSHPPDSTLITAEGPTVVGVPLAPPGAPLQAWALAGLRDQGRFAAAPVSAARTSADPLSANRPSRDRIRVIRRSDHSANSRFGSGTHRFGSSRFNSFGGYHGFRQPGIWPRLGLARERLAR